MINVTFFSKDDRYIGVHSLGHAKQNETLCTSVSTILYTIASMLVDVLEIECILEIEEDKGSFYLMVKEPDESNDVQLLFTTLKTGLIGIYKEYPEELTLYFKEETW